jgi:hypothetical protein
MESIKAFDKISLVDSGFRIFLKISEWFIFLNKMACRYCKGKGYIPYIYSRMEVYSIRWHGCDLCNQTGREAYQNRGKKGCPGTKKIGYIPKGARVPTIEEVLGYLN